MTQEELKDDYERRFNEIKDSNILEEVIKLYNTRVVGEEDNIKLLWCACISKDLPKKYRLSVIITSQSSAGKSNLTNSVLEPFNDDVLEFTDYTQAYLQRTEWNMNGKIMKMEQMERTNEKRQIRNKLEQLAKKEKIVIVPRPHELAAKANRTRSSKLRKYHHYIRLIQDNFPDLDYNTIRKQLSERKQGKEVSIPDVIWQN